MGATPTDIVRLADYRPFPFAVDEVRLVFVLDPLQTRVHSTLKLRRTGAAGASLRLDGEKLDLKSVRIDGEDLGRGDFDLSPDALTLRSVPDAFDLSIETLIAPQDNTELSGLYMSGGRYCTQCEAEGFRRITYFPDRPDVLARYSVRIEAPRGFPFLLSNGDPVDAGETPDGGRFAEWRDPHPKPSYLFALVAGDFDVLRDTFTTRSGRNVALGIHVDRGDAPRARFAMDSLKHAMRWDEDVFGREYDLDVFNIVAVRDFNFGAMENKGLNIFNSAYVLADGETATDADFEAIESIVAHEYFHNWTGNRITCRDWFQLCLKEGLTVYRDQEFTKSLRSPAVTRIKEVLRLRTRQFSEDAGPLAHPVRPEAYRRIDNLYTATVYEKGAEVIRMLRLLIGEQAFFAGMNRYFDRHDGQAATIEDFLAAFQPSTDIDLAPFSRWYAQAGTPVLTLETQRKGKALFLRLSQSTAPTPGQPDKSPLTLPIRLAAFDVQGRPVPTVLDGVSAHEHTLKLEGASAERQLKPPRGRTAHFISVNRGFSAPIRVMDAADEAERAQLASINDDPINQWDSIQRIARDLICDTAASSGPPPEPRVDLLVEAVASGVERAGRDDAFSALLLHLPTVGELVSTLTQGDPDRLHDSRCMLQAAIARRLQPLLEARVEAVEPEVFDASAASTGRRALKSAAMTLLSRLGHDQAPRLRRGFGAARTMTESLAALGAMSNLDGPDFDDALARFEHRWSNAPLIMDKWFGVQAAAVRTDVRARLERLVGRDDFDLHNPNRVRSVYAVFAGSNPVAFHASDGWGYRFLADAVLKVDPLNPALSARLTAGFESWRRFDGRRQAEAQRQLGRLAAAGLSRNARDIVDRALDSGS